jgi:lipoyl(octanoyl) transferase
VNRAAAPRCLRLGLLDYAEALTRMREFTERRTAQTGDELWLLQHPPVFTQGQAGKAEHLLAPGQIPVLQVDRGGQVTYHGPGQWVVYLLLDLRRRGLGVRALVDCIERALIDLLDQYGISANADPHRPGVYVGEAKIASLGLRVRRGCSYHGLALNVDMDLSPFACINPCGYADLAVTSMAQQLPGVPLDQPRIGEQLLAALRSELRGH